MDQSILNRVSNKNIESAGARYTPTLDPNAPNLQITTLVEAIDALALNDSYSAYLSKLEESLLEAWKKFPRDLKGLFAAGKPTQLATILKQLRIKKFRKNDLYVEKLRKLSKSFLLVLQSENERLWEQTRGFDEDSEEARRVRTVQSSLRDLRLVIGDIQNFTDSHSSSLATNNRMFLLGEWGSGKTHLLSDITKQRQGKGLPTLFLLAHHLPTGMNPLEGICASTGISTDTRGLLRDLNKLGKKTDTRTLLIIDGINEGDRKVWKKYMVDILHQLSKYPHVGLILSCRSPFDQQILSTSTRKLFTHVFHPGFQEIEFDAQRSFFNYYKIPTPNIPLLTPEFSRPLFLKILCKTFSGETSTGKSKWIKDLASGQKTMTKLFEDFVKNIGKTIEDSLGLPNMFCWNLLMHYSTPTGQVSIAGLMADQVKDYLLKEECFDFVKKATGKTKAQVEELLKMFMTEGLLVEDFIWEAGKSKNIIRFPYQRFSDHLIARHLLNKHFITSSESSVRRSFYISKPLGKIFEIDQWGHSYKMPGLASALMIEFPERAKNVLPNGERELVYYLPRKRRLLQPLIDIFLEGALWRDGSSFTKQTDSIFGMLIDSSAFNVPNKTFEVLVTLACRHNHPYSANRLYTFLSKKSIVERDLLWSEFLRKTQETSVVHRLLNWIEDTAQSETDQGVANNLVLLLSLFLTTTDKTIRDRATKALVILGDKSPSALFSNTLNTLGFNDPYVPERMIAACYGTLMRNWAFPSANLKKIISVFASNFYDSIFKDNAPYSTSHILRTDYSLGIMELARKINRNCLRGRSLKNLKLPLQSKIKIPSGKRITEDYCKGADSSIYMDFNNYTIGRLVKDRQNYDDNHVEYRQVRRQIKWRILNLGYTSKVFEQLDREIGRNTYREMQDKVRHIDRYGKKYSWIAFFEVAGIRANLGLLPKRYSERMSDCDIDPSFPESLKTWEPKLNDFFKKPFVSIKNWVTCGYAPDYGHLLEIDNVDSEDGPWVLIGGHISEASPNDSRKVFTFLNTVLVSSKDVSKLRRKFKSKNYPGNREIPEPYKDYYTFVGEIPWSKKYASDLILKGKKQRRIDTCFNEHKTIKIRKKYTELTASDYVKSLPSRFEFVTENDTVKVVEKDIEIPKYVIVERYKNVPGVKVEIPIHEINWESYHSPENQGGTADFLAPALCDFLKLKNKGNSQDLVDQKGKPASLYRYFKNDPDYWKSNLMYIRKDLLKEYLKHTGQKLVWFVWGERDFKTETLQEMREEIHALWEKYPHVHKMMKVARL